MGVNGWLSPSGIFFPCNQYEHSSGAGTGLTELELELRGYVKIFNDDYYRAYGQLTTWQEDKLEQLGIEVIR